MEGMTLTTESEKTLRSQEPPLSPSLTSDDLQGETPSHTRLNNVIHSVTDVYWNETLAQWILVLLQFSILIGRVMNLL